MRSSNQWLKCHNFFIFLIGKDVIITKVYEPLRSNHSLSFYYTVEDFYQSNGNNGWRDHINLMEINLGSCYFERWCFNEKEYEAL